jgi:hypothetical protein
MDIPGSKELWPTIPAGGAQAYFDRSKIENTIEDIIVRVQQNEEPAPDKPVTITADWIKGSGGHNHNAGNDLKKPPKEKMGWIVNVEEADSSRGELATTTNGNGQIHLRYRAPEFGGQVKLIAQTINTQGDILSTDDQLTVRVPELVPLTDANIYEKIGGTPSHHGPRLDTSYPNSRSPDNNHWINETVGAILVSFSITYAEQFPKSPAVRYNDISLPSGGRFDINGRGSGSHTLHRLGQNVDVRTSPPQDDGILLINIEEIRDVIQEIDPNATVEEHGSIWTDQDGTRHDTRHFHIDFEIFN